METQLNLEDDFTEDDKKQTRFWDYKNKETPSCIGYFVRFDEDKFSQHAVLRDEKGEFSLPSLTALNNQLKDVKEGQKVKVVYTGLVDNEKGTRQYATFEIFIK